MKRVSKESFLDLQVQRRISAKARTVIDFEQPWLALAIKEDVHAKYLEAE